MEESAADTMEAARPDASDTVCVTTVCPEPMPLQTSPRPQTGKLDSFWLMSLRTGANFISESQKLFLAAFSEVALRVL